MAKKKPEKPQEQANDPFDFPDFGGEWGGGEFDPDLYDFLPEEAAEETRYCKPKARPIKRNFVLYENAEKLAADINIEAGTRYDIFLNGSFIFGDFIEAFVTRNNCKCKRLLITTLSLSQENVDSLANLIGAGYIDQLDIIISQYFWSNERNNLVPYMYRALDIDNRFQLAVAAIHTKTVQIETLGGKKIVIHGSANLRSSANIEMFTIEEDPELYAFFEECFDNIIAKYKTLNKSSAKREIWEAMQYKSFKE